MPKKKKGKQTVMTKATFELLRQAFLIGATDEEAASYAKIGVSTLYKYQKEHPEYVEEKEAYKREPILLAKNTVVKQLKENLTNAQWYLERKAKDEFGTRREITGAEGKDLIPDILNELERTDYDKLGQQAKKQIVAPNPPLQDKGQVGPDSDVQAEPDTMDTSSEQGEPQV